MTGIADSPDRLLDALARIAVEAGALVMRVYVTPFAVDYKGPQDPVTEADRGANALICDRLNRAWPGVPVVAEESDPAVFAGFRAAERVFFVDPLDGTREFVDRNGEFAVMIGLLEGERPLAGVVHAPARGETWMGAVGLGAWRAAADGSGHPIGVSAVSDLARGRVVASRSHRSAGLVRALGALGAGETLALGSSGLKAAWVAEGRAEAYVDAGGGSKRWDACAAEALVLAAGGRFTDTRGEPIDYRGPDLRNARGLVATNGRVHDLVLARLAGAR